MHRKKRTLPWALGVAATVAAAAAVPALATNPHGAARGNSANAHAHVTHGSSHAKGSGHVKGSANGKGKGSGQSGSHGNSANAHTHVTICHATPPDTAANGYVLISPSASGVFHGHLRQHDADIIPPFTYNGVTYSENWDATGQAIWNNGCAVPSSTTTTSSSTSGQVGGATHGKGGSHGKGKGKVSICHATPPATAANGYVLISLSISGAYHGHFRKHAADIIPPFDFKGTTYSLNWDATGQAIFANGCVVPSTTTTTTTTTTTGVTTTSTGGVAGSKHTIKRVTHHARAARAVVRAASFTG